MPRDFLRVFLRAGGSVVVEWALAESRRARATSAWTYVIVPTHTWFWSWLATVPGAQPPK
jgi:hypothetical protein